MYIFILYIQTSVIGQEGPGQFSEKIITRCRSQAPARSAACQ